MKNRLLKYNEFLVNEANKSYDKSSWKDFLSDLENNGWKTKERTATHIKVFKGDKSVPSSFKAFKGEDHKDIKDLPKRGELEIHPSQYEGTLDWVLYDDKGNKVWAGDYPKAARITASQLDNEIWATIKFLMNGPL
jgi:hypothetical protein